MKKIASGSTSAEIKGGDLLSLLDKIAPELRRSLQDEIEDLYQSAFKQWPVKKKNSRGSKKLLERGVTIERRGSGMAIVGYVRNTAPYAWAIKVGVETEAVIPLGRRIASELLWKPAQKQADKVAEALSADLMKAQKKKGK